MTPERFPCGKQIGSYVGPQDYKRALAVDAEKKENERERERKTPLDEKRSVLKKSLTGPTLLEMSGKRVPRPSGLFPSAP